MLKVNETAKNLINTMQVQYVSKIKNLEDILKQNNVELKELKIELQEKNSQIVQDQHERYEHIRCLEQQILELQQCVEEKNGQIEKQQQKQQEVEQEQCERIHCLEQQILELQQCVEEKNGQIEKHEMNNNKLNKKIEELKNETIEKMQKKNMILQELTNENENKMKLIEEINKIVLKNNLYFEQTNLELSSNKIKIEELKTLYDNVNKELGLKQDELVCVKKELDLARNNYILKQYKQ
jgi:chromosome segregation ATPase